MSGSTFGYVHRAVRIMRKRSSELKAAASYHTPGEFTKSDLITTQRMLRKPKTHKVGHTKKPVTPSKLNWIKDDAC